MADRSLLVVSPDPDVQDALRFGLTTDLDVVCVNDATAAIGSLQTFTPALVVVDLLIGPAGGFALARDMSQDRRLARIPVIILVERDQDRWLAKQAGAALVLRKPVDPNVFEPAVSTLLDQPLPA